MKNKIRMIRLLSGNLLIAICIGLSVFACKKDGKGSILIAKNDYFDFMHDSLSDSLMLLKDSSFVFVKSYKSADNEMIDKRKGRYDVKNDTIYFSRNLFNDSESTKGVIKNGFLEIVDSDVSYKIKVLTTTLKNRSTFDTDKYKNYTVFSYSTQRDTNIFVKAKQHDLNDKEIAEVDSILCVCIKQNSRLKNINNEDYLKQCIAIEDSANQVIVWAYCICKNAEYHFSNNFQRQIYGKVNDGGNCFFRLKFNLTKRTYFNLSVNGDG